MTTEIINPPETDEEMFVSYIDKIRKEVECAADNWLHIAYYVYELNYFGYYKKHFDNIVDCCQANFGFKKSTTYNFINIVEQFADNVGMVKSKPKLQYVGFNDFFNAVRQWSYSQLVAMLSLSDKQREQATPEMSAREIKRLKTDSKRLENNSAESSETAPAEIVIDESASPAPAEVVESEPAAPAPADVVSKDEFERVLCDYDARIDKLYDDINEANEKYEAERDSNHRINIKLCNMTAERDKALQDIDEFKQQVKKLRSENRKLKAEIKALKSSSEPGSDC
jgi:hypothetical protein